MATTELKDTGERMIPELHGDSIMYAEHMTRYIAAKTLVKDKVVLDIASGTGYGSRMLSDSAAHVYGVDASEVSVEYASKHYGAGNITYMSGRAEKIPLDNASIDVVVCFETLEHIKEYKVFLKEIRRVLKPNGLAILSTPNDAEFAEGNHFHVHQFNGPELTNVLSEEFKFLKPYYQATWTYAQVSDEQLIRGSKTVADIEVHNFSPLNPGQYSYFYLLCSNRPITEEVKSVGGLGGHYSAREQEVRRLHQEKELTQEFQQEIAHERNEHRKTKIKLKAKEREIHDITTSSSYKLARLMAKSKHVARQGLNQAKELNPKRIRMLSQNKRHVKAIYDASSFSDAFDLPATAELAVIIHLYYTDMFPFFLEKLRNISSLKYDLYLTVPEGKEAAIEAMRQQVPNARIGIVPNCGRDVLPFVQVMKQIEKHGYSKVLKLHSKKSPHRNDGQQWRDKIVDSLLPTSNDAVSQISKRLSRQQTALIGPNGEYVSLLVNFSATAHYLKMLTGKIIDGKTGDELIRTADEYGFFGGTMFWARTDALMPIIHNVNIEDFEPELGQEDSTLAHALERLLNIIPELQGKDIFEMQPDGVVKIDHHSTNIPSWSEVALED